MDNIRPINTKPDELAGAVENMKRQMPLMLEHMALVAQLKHAYFSALVKQGFTAEQALELSKHGALI